jgi:AcrR family transcriptional regulator
VVKVVAVVRGRKRSGRRPGSPDTREEILAAARNAFASDGFERSSIRRIAADAGVDPALVHHYFGTKDQLFLAAVEAPFDPGQVLPQLYACGIGDIGERLVSTFIEIWDSPTGNRAAAFVRSAVNHPQMSKLVQQFFMTQIVDNALRKINPDLDHPQLRGSLVASQLLGLAVTRYILKFQPLADMSVSELVRIYGPTVQRYITMDIDDLDLTDSSPA